MSSVATVFDVNMLRRLGYSVRVTHYRKYRSYKNGKVVVDLLPNYEADLKYALPRGGEVEVRILDSEQEYVGIARCNDSDAYNKKLGVQLAITRAIEQMLISTATK